MHSVFARVFDNRLIFPPIRNPRKVLDCGFGPGDWAIDVAERFEDCEVCDDKPLLLCGVVFLGFS